MQLSDAYMARLGPHLEPGEHVLWAGAPASWRFASRRQIAAVIGLFGFALLTTVILAALDAILPPRLLPVAAAVAIAGLGLNAIRLALWFGRRFGESYGVTDRRVLILDRKGSIQAQASLLKASEFRLEGPPGRGTIRLGEDQPIWTLVGGLRPRLSPELDAPRLSALADAPSVLERIRSASAAWERTWSAS